jgi:antitoxin component of MazEF toxin-antitoxin module
VLPDEVFAAANAKPDDEVVITVTGSGTIQIARSTASVSEQLEKAKDIARRYQNALRELAK